MTAKHMTEAQAVNLVRNALLAAGHEMGKDGDHWPVIKSTIYSIVRDWEELQIERNVDAEMKIHLYEQLEDMERNIDSCPAETRADIAQKLKELREVYDAYFSNVDLKLAHIDAKDLPAHVRRAKVIMDTLEDDND